MSRYSIEQRTVYQQSGEPTVLLNGTLLDRQGVSEEGLEAIKDLHVQCLAIEEAMCNADSPEKLKELFAEWTARQFALQDFWGFPRDAKFHKFWRLPQCSCAKLDNEDAYPTGYYVVNIGCLVHGE